MSMNKFLSKFSALTSDNIVQFIGGTVEMCKYWEKLRKMMKCYRMKTKHKYFCAIEIGFCLHSIPIRYVVANEKNKANRLHQPDWASENDSDVLIVSNLF